jgi:predicted RNA-binding Zn-ribbon protein involved in translation (DUF1610 family)
MRKTKSKRKHKQDLQLDAAQQEAIRQKIAASMAKKAARIHFNCPACGVTLTRADGVLTHMQRCCADLLPQQLQQQQEQLEQQKHDTQQVRLPVVVHVAVARRLSYAAHAGVTQGSTQVCSVAC